VIRSMTGVWWCLVRFGFRLLYNEMAFTYDAVSWVVSLGAWRCWQRSALEFLTPDSLRVLEIAHGTGNLQLDLHEMGLQVVGYDLSPAMGRIARQKLRNYGYNPNLVRGRAQTLPLSDAHFDAVVCTFPTDFILQPATLGEVRRVLRPGGRFIVVLSGTFVGRGIMKQVLEWAYRATGQREEYGLDLSAYFMAQGFKDVAFHAAKCPQSTAHLVVMSR